MRKLKLDLDVLAVESFAMDAAREKPGTVRGHDSDSGHQTCADSCDGVCGSYCCGSGTEPNSCDFSCIWTCDTCNQYNCM